LSRKNSRLSDGILLTICLYSPKLAHLAQLIKRYDRIVIDAKFVVDMRNSATLARRSEKNAATA
jgi:hypothetical protein